MVTKILTGIQVTSVNYQEYAKPIWITCLCLGLLIAFFGQSPSSGIALIVCCVVGLPAYLIDLGQKQKAKTRKTK